MAATTTHGSAGADGTLRGLRKQAGLTQVQVAIASGYSVTFIGQLEAGLIPKRSSALAHIIATITQGTPNANGASGEETPNAQHRGGTAPGSEL